MKRLIIIFFSITLLFFAGCEDSTSPVVTSEIQTDTPENQGIDQDLLEAGHTAAEMLGFVNAMLVARNGKLVSEKYFRGTDEESHHNVRSVSKSFTAALTGIAVDLGYIDDLEKKVMDYFPEYEDQVVDSKFNQMTIENLLNMEAGFRGDRDIYMDIFYSDNWLDEIFSQQLTFIPGTSIRYSTATTHLLGVIVARASGMSLKEFAERFLFNKLGITADRWNIDPQGNYYGGSDLQFQPRELLKFGLMYQYNGKYNDEQIIPAQWVSDTFELGYRGVSSWGAIDKLGYGYCWWKGEINGYAIYTALGFGGQYVMLVPDLDLVVVTSCYSEVDWDKADLQEQQVSQIISDYIIPAVN